MAMRCNNCTKRQCNQSSGNACVQKTAYYVLLQHVLPCTLTDKSLKLIFIQTMELLPFQPCCYGCEQHGKSALRTYILLCASLRLLQRYNTSMPVSLKDNVDLSMLGKSGSLYGQ